jgi:thiol-disulfide isomerase/thioredoxin
VMKRAGLFLGCIGLVAAMVWVMQTASASGAADRATPAAAVPPAAIPTSAGGNPASVEVKIEVGHNDPSHVTPEFTFKGAPSPAKDTAASTATVTIVDGVRDRNSGDVGVLIDGRLPTEEDQPGANFFFDAGTDGGRLLIDLGGPINIKQVATYSWHTDDRAPQVYTLYAADGTAAGFNAKPAKEVDLEKAGWKLIAKVDTRPKSGDVGGQYGVSISGDKGTLGKYRYLLMAASRTESNDTYGNTFFSEINVIDADKPAPPLAIPPGSVKKSDKLAIAVAERKSQETLAAIKALVQDPGVFADAAPRAEALKKAAPLFEQLDKDLAEITKLAPGDPGRVDQLLATADPFRAALGETATVERLRKQAESKTPKEAAIAKAVLARAAFLTAGKDAAAQEKALEGFEAALKADPASDAIASYMVQSHDAKTTAPAVADRIEKIMKDMAQSDTGDFALDDWTCARRLAALTGNPLVIKMPKADGTAFSTDSLKGKVILVDIWATWCGPCVKELPHVAQVYQKYHDQGLEVVGVSCDRRAEDLKAFLESHKEITWTQLYDPKLPEWDAAKQFGVLSIPKMFLIDKKGIVRTIEARENMEEMIPKLLAE